MTRILIHPGLAKTATTTLQKGVFSQLPDINYLGVFSGDDARDHLIRSIAKIDSLEWDEQGVREAFSHHLDPEKINVLSYENLAWHEAKDKGLVVKRLHALFPNAHILFTIRRQQDLVRSWYLQNLQKIIRDNSYVSLDVWFENALKDPELSIISDLTYYAIISEYETVFGEGNVSVLLYEDLKKDPDIFAGQLSEIIDVKAEEIAQKLKARTHNPSLTARAAGFAKVSSLCMPKIFFKLGQKIIPDFVKDQIFAGPSAKPQLSQRHSTYIQELCAQGNTLLAEKYNLPLEKYRYNLTK